MRGCEVSNTFVMGHRRSTPEACSRFTTFWFFSFTVAWPVGRTAFSAYLESFNGHKLTVSQACSAWLLKFHRVTHTRTPPPSVNNDIRSTTVHVLRHARYHEARTRYGRREPSRPARSKRTIAVGFTNHSH